MAEYICRYCGYEGRTRRKKRGSGTVETLLWTVLFIPGPFYSIWRRTGRDVTCLNCDKPGMVNIKSDAGWVALQRVKKEIERAKMDGAPKQQPEPPMPKRQPVDPEQW